MKKYLSFVFVFVFVVFCLNAQQRLSMNIDIGRTIGISNFQQIRGYNPHFVGITDDDLGYDVSLKYYLKPKAALDFGISYYIRLSGAGISANSPNNFSNKSLTDGGSVQFTLRYLHALKGNESSKFRIWWLGGIHLEQIKNREALLGGFMGLITTDYRTKTGWYPRLNTGLAMDWKMRNGNLGLKLIGGLGFYYHNYYFYTGTAQGVSYDAVSKYKGDYIGLLATWEYGLPRRYKKDKSKKSKKKKRK